MYKDLRSADQQAETKAMRGATLLTVYFDLRAGV